MPTFTHPELDGDIVINALVASGFVGLPPSRRPLTVLDTFDGRLHAADLQLVLDGAPTGTLMLSNRSGQPGPPARLEGATAPTWPHDLPPGPFRARLAAVTEERALLPVFTVSARHRTFRRADRRGNVVASVELLDGITAPGTDPGRLPPWVAQVVPIAGHDDAAATAAAVLHDLGAVNVPGDAIDLLAEACGVALTGHRSSPTVPLSADEPASGGFRRVLMNLAGTIDDNFGGAIAATDPEFLHELRVAVRRTRSVLAEAKGALPTDVRDRYREGFGWLGSVTGPPRDLDVYLLGWEGYVAPLSVDDITALEPARIELQRRRLEAHARLAETLQSDATRDLLEGWRRWLTDAEGAAGSDARLGEHVAHRIAKAQAKVLRDGRAMTPSTPAERLHDLRKDTKKLRYLLECFGSLFPSKPRKAFVSQLKSLQDNLGDHQDAEIHLLQLRELAQDLRQQPSVDAEVLLAMGRLSDLLERRRVRERADFADRFAAYDTKVNRRSLRRLLDSIAAP